MLRNNVSRVGAGFPGRIFRTNPERIPEEIAEGNPRGFPEGNHGGILLEIP